MIGSLRGVLLERGAGGEGLIEVAGVGYRVTMGPADSIALGDVGAEVFVWVHHHIREDAQTLYGFADRDAQRTFEALLGAHGVGPALALAILSVHRPDALRQVLLHDDVAALCLVPGVGKKTAARLLLELKPRLTGSDALPADTPGTSGALMGDVGEALAGLGYSSDEVGEALRNLDVAAGDDVSTVLRRALQRLAVRT